jgi:hypothetical protein
MKVINPNRDNIKKRTAGEKIIERLTGDRTNNINSRSTQDEEETLLDRRPKTSGYSLMPHCSIQEIIRKPLFIQVTAVDRNVS